MITWWGASGMGRWGGGRERSEGSRADDCVSFSLSATLFLGHEFGQRCERWTFPTHDVQPKMLSDQHVVRGMIVKWLLAATSSESFQMFLRVFNGFRGLRNGFGFPGRKHVLDCSDISENPSLDLLHGNYHAADIFVDAGGSDDFAHHLFTALGWAVVVCIIGYYKSRQSVVSELPDLPRAVAEHLAATSVALCSDCQRGILG
jgi:hypothetical protein